MLDLSHFSDSSDSDDEIATIDEDDDHVAARSASTAPGGLPTQQQSSSSGSMGSHHSSSVSSLKNLTAQFKQVEKSRSEYRIPTREETIDRSQTFYIQNPEERLDEPFPILLECPNHYFSESEIEQACMKCLAQRGFAAQTSSILHVSQGPRIHSKSTTDQFVLAKNKEIGMTLIYHFLTCGMVVVSKDGEMSHEPIHAEPAHLHWYQRVIEQNLPRQYQVDEMVVVIATHVPVFVHSHRSEMGKFFSDVLGMPVQRYSTRLNHEGKLVSIFIDLTLYDAFRLIDKINGRTIVSKDDSKSKFRLHFSLAKRELRDIWAKYRRYWPKAEASISGFPQSMSTLAIVSLANQITPVHCWWVGVEGAKKILRVLCQDSTSGADTLKKEIDGNTLTTCFAMCSGNEKNTLFVLGHH